MKHTVYYEVLMLREEIRDSFICAFFFVTPSSLFGIELMMDSQADSALFQISGTKNNFALFALRRVTPLIVCSTF